MMNPQAFGQGAPAATFTPPQFTAPYNAPQGQPQGNAAAQAQGQQAPAPVVQGTLAAGWNQGAPSSRWGTAAKWPTEGFVFSGIVAREWGNVEGDCVQSKDPGTGQYKFFPKSGQPQLEFRIPLYVANAPDYTDGKSMLFTSKYKLHQAIVRAMINAGYTPDEGLHFGDLVQVQRIGDVMVGMGRAHEFVAEVTRAGTFDPAQLGITVPAEEDPANPIAPAPAAFAPASASYSSPAQATAPGNPFVPQQGGPVDSYQVFTPPQSQGNFPVDPTAVTSVPAQGFASQAAGVSAQVPAQTQAPVAPSIPAGVPNSIPQIPGLTPEQAALVAQYGAGQSAQG